jgi:hypothetical protein
VIFNAEKVDGGYKFYTTVDGVKNYVYAKTTVDGTKVSKYIGFNTEEGSVFTYNADIGGVWTVSIEGNTYGVGTYGSYNTICISDASFFSTSSVGSSQFVLQIVTAEYANSQTEDADLPTYKDAAEILNLLYALEDGKTMAGNFYLTGKITALDSYGNPTIVVEGFEDKPVLCYKLTDERFVEGATISVYAKVLKNYKGTYELEQCEVKTFLAPSEGGETTDTYGVVTELKTGDHVLIGNPSNGKLLSANKTGFYNIGVDYTADNFSQVTDAEIWVVTVNDDGSYSFTSLTGEKLGMADEFSSFNSAGPHFNWAIEAKDGANGIFYIKNTVRGNYIEWYADKGNWSSYTNPNSDLYELSFYAKGATGSDTPVDPQPPVHEHNFVEGKCECGETDPNYQPPTVDPEGNEIVFDFGANGAAGTHVDGNDIGTTKSFTSGNYTLELTDALKAYAGGFDKAGNSILKFGTSSVAGTVTFVVPENVTSVIIYAARYKSYADNNIIVVNGTSYTLTANSDDGQYEAITVDTTANKTVTIASSTSAAKPRCVVNNIVWILGEGGSDTPVDPQPPVHEHNFVEGKCECGETDPNYVPPTVDPETPAFGVVTPVAGTAYKFGMVQVKAGKTVYLKGGMSGYYMATTEDVNAAIDVYLEETTSGYYLYTLNADGSKTYINMVVSGTHVNGAYEATASTVYTFDAARMSIVATVNGELYHFGTRNDNTYLTVGPCKISYNGFDCQFYGNTNGSNTPVEPPHEHNFVEGKCECGETDPNYQPPHEHNFVEGKCECGETDPNYVAPETPDQTKGGSADFDTIVLPSSKPNGDSSYTATYTTANGWTSVNSAIQCGGSADINPQFTVIGPDNSHKAICMNGKVSAPGAITSPTLAGGVSKITINYTKMFTDTELSFDVIVTNLATGEKQTYNVAKTLDKSEKYVVYTAEIVLDTAIEGEFTIELVNKCPTGNTGNKDRTTILSIDWE